MFNTQRWSELIADTYGYQSGLIGDISTGIFFNWIGTEPLIRIVSPSFGDFIDVSDQQLDSLSKHAENLEAGYKLKVCCDKEPMLKGFRTDSWGYIHRLDFNSYAGWKDKQIKGKFRNQIHQGEKNGLKVKISAKKTDLDEFWSLHALLRMEKFQEIPQPRQFFSNLHNIYLKRDRGFLVGAYGPGPELLAGIVVLIERDTAYYKYSASRGDSLMLRPNNYLLDRLIFQLDGLGLKKLNLGYTGATREYEGLRHYKLSAGASESIRYKLTNNLLFDNRKKDEVDEINEKIRNLIAKKPSLEVIDEFSNYYYKYFV